MGVLPSAHCDQESPVCRRISPAEDDRYTASITPELIAKLGACGVGCKGELAALLRSKGHCGIPGAIMEAMAWQLPGEGDTGLLTAMRIADRILLEGVEPHTLITDPPAYLSPHDTGSQ